MKKPLVCARDKYIDGDRITHFCMDMLLLIIAVLVLYPIYYVLIASISHPSAISTGEVLILPKGLNLDAYKKLLENKSIWIGYRNSILYTSAAVLVDLFIQITTAFALSREKMPARKVVMTMFVITMYFSGGMIPKYLLLNSLGLINTPLAMILPNCISAYNIIVAKNFFENNIPDSLYDASCIDGCGYIGYFVRIVIPLSKAIIAIIALYSMQTHWNAYLTAQMYIYKSSLYTLQQVISSITATLDTSLVESMSTGEYAAIMQTKQLIKYAVVVVSSIPLVIIYPFVQKFFVRGIMLGAVKG